MDVLDDEYWCDEDQVQLGEVLTYLFRLCFNQCNASLHFGSSKHSAYFQNPPSQSLLLTLWSLFFFLMVVLVPKSFCFFSLLFSQQFLCHDHKSYTARVVYYFTGSPFAYQLCSIVPTASARMHPISCIHPRFASCVHS